MATEAQSNSLWLRYQTTNQRGFHKCLDQLIKIRAQRFKEAIGFERQNSQPKARAAGKAQPVDLDSLIASIADANPTAKSCSTRLFSIARR